MSYYRFSTDAFQCDVYVYESERGFVTHVASRKYVSDATLPARPNDGDYIKLAEWANEAAAIVKAGPLEPIGLARDGETFLDPTAGQCADRLKALRADGYRVPDGAVGALEEDARDDEEQTP